MNMASKKAEKNTACLSLAETEYIYLPKQCQGLFFIFFTFFQFTVKSQSDNRLALMRWPLIRPIIITDYNYLSRSFRFLLYYMLITYAVFTIMPQIACKSDITSPLLIIF